MRQNNRIKLIAERLRRERERESEFVTILYACAMGTLVMAVVAMLFFFASGCSAFQTVTQNPNSKYAVCASVCASAMAACRTVETVDGTAVQGDDTSDAGDVDTGCATYVVGLDAGVPMVDDLMTPGGSRTIGNLDGVIETVDTILGRLDSLDDCMARCGEVYDVLLEGVEACSPGEAPFSGGQQ